MTIREFGVRRPDGADCVAEELTVLCALDHVERRADQLDSELVEHTFVGELLREIQRRLSAHRRQQGVGTLAREHVGDALEVERLEIRAVGETRVGHDRRRVRVHDDRAEAVLAQDLQRLAACVVELAGLPDHDRTGADQADRLEIMPPSAYATSSTHSRMIGQRVVRARPGLRMELHRARVLEREVQPLDRPVVQRDVRRLARV